MSDDIQREHHSKRRLKTTVKAKRQAKIAKSAGLPVDSAHKFAKKHAMNCGNPKCIMCANPRKVWGELTIQEQRFYQVRHLEEHNNEEEVTT